MQEGQLLPRLDHEQPVGLSDAAGDLGEELGPRDADRDREADLLPDSCPELDRDLGRRTRDVAEAADVEKRFVDRQSFDDRRGVLEDLEHGLARLGVSGEPWRHDDSVRTQTERLPAAHRCADPARLGLVARGEHDATADEHRPAAEPGVIALLDRRVERIKVGVDDRGRGGHEHMFDQAADGTENTQLQADRSAGNGLAVTMMPLEPSLVASGWRGSSK